MSIGAELFEENRQRLLALLTRLSYEQREVTLASGAKSNFYIDCKQTVLTAEGHFLVGSAVRPHPRRAGARGRGDRRRDDGRRPARLGGVDAELRRRAARCPPSTCARRPRGTARQPGSRGRSRCARGCRSRSSRTSSRPAARRSRPSRACASTGSRSPIILGLVDREEGGREALEKEAPLSRCSAGATSVMSAR